MISSSPYNANRIEQNRDNFAVLGPTEKKIQVHLCFVLMPCLKFQEPISGNMQTEIWTSQTNMHSPLPPPQSLKKLGA